MSTEAPETADSGPEVEVPDRAEIIDLLGDGIEEAHRKVVSGRVYDAEAEKVRIQWIRALAYAAGQYRQLKKDQDLEELEERIAELEGSR